MVGADARRNISTRSRDSESRALRQQETRQMFPRGGIGSGVIERPASVGSVAQ